MDVKAPVARGRRIFRSAGSTPGPGEEQSPETGIDPGEFPFKLLEGAQESRYLTWIRNHSNYMAVSGFEDYARAVGVLVRGAAINFLVFLPVLLLIAVGTVIYGDEENRTPIALGVLALVPVYLAITWPGSFFELLRSLARTLWGLSFFTIIWVLLGGIAVWYAAADSVPDYLPQWSTRFPLTLSVAVIGALWTAAFAVGTPLFKMQRYQRTIATGSDSSVKLRDAYERSFGSLLLGLIAVASFESIAALVPIFHQKALGFGFWTYAGIAGIAFIVIVVADAILAALVGSARRLAIVAMGLVGSLVPVLCVLLVANYLLHKHTYVNLDVIQRMSWFLPVLIAYAMGFGWRALSWRDAGWGAVLAIAASTLLAIVLASQSFLDDQRDSIDSELLIVAQQIGEGSIEPTQRRRLAIDLNRTPRQFSRVFAISTTFNDWRDQNFAIDPRYRIETPMTELQRASLVEFFSSIDVPAYHTTVEGLMTRSDGMDVVLSWRPHWCPRFDFHRLSFDLRDFYFKGKRHELVCRIWNVRREFAMAVSLDKSWYPAAYDSWPAESVRRAALATRCTLVVIIALLLGFVVWLTVDVNLTSIHGLYRDRLATAFLTGIDTKGDVDIEEDLNLEALSRHDAGSIAPYHLINVALNLQGSDNILLRDRKCDFFIFSKRFIGGRFTGYCRSESMEQVFPQLDLATAMAISAGAASPNMGRATTPALVAIMTLLNIRMGFWLPNPGQIEPWLSKRKEKKSRDGKSGKEKETHALLFDHPKAETTVFGEELGEIRRRWENLPNGSERTLATVGERSDLRPNLEHGLVGIAFSGGGIRSATLNLGITQALHTGGVFEHADYMSTVSGGGYLGSSISALMRHKSKTSSEIAGVVSLEETDDGPIVRVRPSDESQMVREYRYKKDVRLRVSNEEVVEEGQRLIFMESSPEPETTSFGQYFSWRIRPSALMREVIGKLDEDHHWVNVSDGGHIENLATIELLSRRCQFIIIGDGEEDVAHRFTGLATLMRAARIDLGIEIEINLDAMRLNEKGLCQAHWALGRIKYPDEEKPGYLLYLKASLTGREDEIIGEYRRGSPDFPHESTADQSFTEGQFEAYRSLGEHIGNSVLRHGAVAKLSYEDLGKWFSALEEHQRNRQSEEQPMGQPAKTAPGLSDERPNAITETNGEDPVRSQA